MLKQPQYSPLDISLQIVSLYAVENGYMDKIAVDQVLGFERALHRDMQAKHAGLLAAIEEKGVLDDDMLEELKAGISESLDDYLMVTGA